MRVGHFMGVTLVGDSKTGSVCSTRVGQKSAEREVVRGGSGSGKKQVRQRGLIRVKKAGVISRENVQRGKK